MRQRRIMLKEKGVKLRLLERLPVLFRLSKAGKEKSLQRMPTRAAFQAAEVHKVQTSGSSRAPAFVGERKLLLEL